MPCARKPQQRHPPATPPPRIIAPLPIPVGQQCDCWRLTGILAADEALPGLPLGYALSPGTNGVAVHVCGDTARATVRGWVQRAFYTPSIIMSACLDHQLTDATWADLLAVGNENQLAWPLRHDGRALGLVLRQWADGADSDDADLGLARRIVAHPAWEGLVTLQATIDAHPDAPPAVLARLSGLPFAGNDLLDPEFFDATERGVLFRLRQVGLPATARTVRFLRASARGERESLPGRGVLVTTLVYMAPSEDGAWAIHDGNPSFEITGQHAFTRKELLLRAYAIVSAHRAWLDGFMAHPLTSRQAVATALPTALTPAADLILDYEREALDATNLAALRRRLRVGSASKRTAINRYLDEVYERVRKRRERAGEDPKPPAGWRTRAHEAIVNTL